MRTERHGNPFICNRLKLAVLPVVFSMLLLMCSCSSDQGVVTAAGDGSVSVSESVSVTTKKITEQPVKLTMFAMESDKEKKDDNEIRELIASKTGVKVSEIWMTGQYFRNVIDGLLESEKLTDYIYVNERLDEFYERGLLVAWDGYIEQYPNIRNLYTEEEWDMLRQADGHIYSVNIPDGFVCSDARIEGSELTYKAGFAVTTSCKDPDIAFKFINDILSEDIMELRFWGIKGVDFIVNVDGSYYRDREMTDNWNNEDYEVEHICQYRLMPRRADV
ncbi:hypothetical protein [Butyrivibrio sp. AE2032]|uniref:hypothetical protein n=1 Tax=Butyrivibrio sp. AE2032 TaxID=1458463 RepID=UPI00163A50BC|nr:hypothetical protein [Butyrivibrio sp. AE2032]